jgi:hypothetical protein
LILVPVEQRTILLEQVGPLRLDFAVPARITLVTWAEEAQSAILQPVENPVSGRVGWSVSNVVKVDVWLDARPDFRVDCFFLESIEDFTGRERPSIRVLAVKQS